MAANVSGVLLTTHVDLVAGFHDDEQRNGSENNETDNNLPHADISLDWVIEKWMEWKAERRAHGQRASPCHSGT